MRIQRQLQNGTWIDAHNPDAIIDGILQREPYAARTERREPLATREQVIEALVAGKTLFYDTDWYALARDADAIKPRAPRPAPRLVVCDCGHEVEAVLVMNTSIGTSCPDCYDRNAL